MTLYTNLFFQKRNSVTCLLWVVVGVLAAGNIDGMAAKAHVLILPQELHSSDGCGPNPLSIVFTAANDLGHMAASEVMAVLESDPDTWGEFLTLIHTYDDCIRAGQLRYKRGIPASRRMSELPHIQNSLRTAILKMPSSLPVPSPYKYGHSPAKVYRNNAGPSQFLQQKYSRQEEP
ncbi:uncharacterized protein [Palaemon carinicauda]|uniref:uncharacterized protein n=1 Tax=Palaemon carinicauda TaxID=392227 RepID=UPI0035B5B483